MVEKLGYTVILAGDGREAVEIFKESHDEIEFVLLDLTMPHMDGEEAFHELRHIKPDARIILSSGYSEDDVAKRFSDKDLAGYIQKPFQLDALKSKIRRVIAT